MIMLYNHDVCCIFFLILQFSVFRSDGFERENRRGSDTVIRKDRKPARAFFSPCVGEKPFSPLRVRTACASTPRSKLFPPLSAWVIKGKLDGHACVPVEHVYVYGRDVWHIFEWYRWALFTLWKINQLIYTSIYYTLFISL